MAPQFVNTRRGKPQESLKADHIGLNSTPDSTPEPDVTWGQGGIDDWGWQVQVVGPASVPSVAAPNPSIPLKEMIPHV